MTLSQRIKITARINMQMTINSLSAMGAWTWWPTSADSLFWWFLSPFLAVLAVAGCIQTLKIMMDIYEHDSAVAEFEAMGVAPRPATMAGGDELERAGMI